VKASGSISAAKRNRMRNLAVIAFLLHRVKTPDYTCENTSWIPKQELDTEIRHPIVAAPRADASADRHPAREKNPDSLFDGDVGIRGAIARTDHDVAEIQMVGRHVDRQQHFRPLPAIDGEFAGHKSDLIAPRPILDTDDALEP